MPRVEVASMYVTNRNGKRSQVHPCLDGCGEYISVLRKFCGPCALKRVNAYNVVMRQKARMRKSVR